MTTPESAYLHTPLADLPPGKCDCTALPHSHVLGVEGCSLAPLRLYRVEESRYERWSVTVPARSEAEALRAARACGMTGPARVTALEVTP